MSPVNDNEPVEKARKWDLDDHVFFSSELPAMGCVWLQLLVFLFDLAIHMASLLEIL